MAISKTQPMRPAEIELVNTVNTQTETLANHTQAIANLITDLAFEVDARTQADTVLDGKITAETSARTQADNVLDGKITAETSARTQADTVLDGKITAETSARTQADTVLDGKITDETSARTQADTVLDGKITAEENQRIAGDNAINAIIGDGFSDQNTITDSLSATNQQVSSLSDDLTDVQSNVTDLQSDVANLLLFEGRLQIGNVTNLTIPANDSISASETFAQPFESGSDCIVLAQVVTSESYTLFDFTLTDCSYSGFSYIIANSDADSHTVSLGYVAIKTSA